MERFNDVYGTGKCGIYETFEDFCSIVAEVLKGQDRRNVNTNSHSPLGQVAAQSGGGGI